MNHCRQQQTMVRMKSTPSKVKLVRICREIGSTTIRAFRVSWKYRCPHQSQSHRRVTNVSWLGETKEIFRLSLRSTDLSSFYFVYSFVVVADFEEDSLTPMSPMGILRESPSPNDAKWMEDFSLSSFLGHLDGPCDQSATVAAVAAARCRSPNRSVSFETYIWSILHTDVNTRIC